MSANGIIGGAAASASGKAKGWELSGVATLPFAERFAAYGKLGLFRFDADVSGTVVIPGFAPIAASGSDTGTSATYGVGLKYEFTDTIGARAEWQRYSRVGGDNTGGKDNVDLLSLGLVVKF